MARASYSADRSPVLSSSCLVSSHLISLPPLVPSPFIPPLYRSQMPLLCSAVWHLQSDSFTPPLSPQGHYIPSQSSTQCAHTHTQHRRDSLPLSICDVDFPPEESWTICTHPALMIKLGQMSHTAELFFFFFLLFGTEDLTFFEITFLITLNEYIYICTRKLNTEKHIFVPRTD